MKCCSDIKKNEILPFSVTRMKVEVIILRATSQRKTNPLCYHLRVEFLKYPSKLGNTETDSQIDRISLLPVRRGKRQGRITGIRLRNTYKVDKPQKYPVQ